jgi:hypothetical protein
MRCLTKEGSRNWCEDRSLNLDTSAHPAVDGRAHSVITPFARTTCSKLLRLSGVLASKFEPFEQCLLWVTLWGIWTSSENWHLFYRLRETYGERRPIWDAPGHLFEKHESADLTTFIQLALIFGWDFYVLSAPSGQVAFVSHDEYLRFCTDDQETAQQIKHLLDKESPAGKG